MAAPATLVLLPDGSSVAQMASDPTSFPIPTTVPSGTTVRIDGSDSMSVINETLKQRFEEEYEAEVNLATNGTDSDLQALLDGDIHLAAIGRSLTEEEKAQGIKEYPISREKLAIFVGANNPFKGNLTFEQFAQIFRGEITDWSQVGGAPGPIRLVDRPEDSDTRRALSNYDVFKTAPFVAGATADPVAEDDTDAVVRNLGTDGIGYAVVSQVEGRDEVTILPMHGTLPDDPRYPYSQVRGYAYTDATAPAVLAFLGFVSSPEGDAALIAAQQAEVAAAAGTPAATDGTLGTTSSAEGEATPAADSELTAVPAETGEVIGEPSAETDEAAAVASSGTSDTQAVPPWLWWLLPLLALLGLLGWWLKRKPAAGAPPTSPATPLPDAAVPPTGVEGAIAPSPDVASPAVAVPEPEPVPPVVAEPVGQPLNLKPVTAVSAAAAAAAAGLAATRGNEKETPIAEPAVEPAVPSIPPVVVEEPIAEPLAEAAIAPDAEPDLVPPVPNVDISPALAAGAAAVGAGAVLGAIADDHSQSDVEAAKFDVGQTDLSSEQLADVDSGLPDLPDGYGESRIVLLPRDPQWAYAYWDIPNEHREELRRQGGTRLALRLYDVTDVDMATQNPHTMQQYDCEEFARDWYLPIPVSDRDYIAEIGYLTPTGAWLTLARSTPAHIPPVYPSDWYDEQFLTISWDEDLRGKTFAELVPSKQKTAINNAIYNALFGMAQSSESLRVAGSLFGSMHQVPEQAISSFVFPSGAGMWAAAPTALPGMNMSGVGMSGVGMMSGVGFSASMPPIRPRKFWLVADAELIVYGATEPDATVTIGDRPIQLSPDGTFRFQMSFQDGVLDFPIKAVAVDGEQTRSIQMTFSRETPERNTNTKDEAIEDWFSS
ncbi:MAG: DUF4912 domain-containing protein [Synechococcales cyanobacterium T60_A2020_003]|nr:DUF4912 domain-containing protein [Synechococcales cyanobacterium T60_A2020_003]